MSEKEQIEKARAIDGLNHMVDVHMSSCSNRKCPHYSWNRYSHCNHRFIKINDEGTCSIFKIDSK